MFDAVEVISNKVCVARQVDGFGLEQESVMVVSMLPPTLSTTDQRETSGREICRRVAPGEISWTEMRMSDSSTGPVTSELGGAAMWTTGWGEEGLEKKGPVPEMVDRTSPTRRVFGGIRMVERVR